MNIVFNEDNYTINPNNLEKIDYFDIQTHKVRIGDLEIYWCPYHWRWLEISKKDEIEKRYKKRLKVIYFNDTIFLVKKSQVKKGLVEGKFYDIALLPIGLGVYWSGEKWEVLDG